jgi:CDP-6-deoxy-D-xylo-4-hexulose-3-dehydrase
MIKNESADSIREEILNLVSKYHRLAFDKPRFVPGVSPVPVSGKVFDDDELRSLVDSSLDFWLTTGRFAAEFESKFASRMGMNHAMLCNSGSSANLLAMSALTSNRLEDRALRAGDEVVTVAAGFPTTVNPILQNGLVPVFVDAQLGTYDASVQDVEEAIGPRTKAIFMAHTLGNPFDLDGISKLAEKHGLWLIEDACDAVGATFMGKPVGSFGDLATASFYPAHHITMGEGGCVLAKTVAMKKIVESFRDWGRDCWCAPGVDNTCGRRFGWQCGDLPYGYDHKYIYSHIGYNLKLTDMQAAVGVAQLGKLDSFIKSRRQNFAYLRTALKDLADFLILPEATSGSDPSWFGFALTVREDAPFQRLELIKCLEESRIGTRQLFGGNLVRQPAYSRSTFRISGDLKNSDLISNNTFWIGVYPGLSETMLDFVVSVIRKFVESH